MGEINGYLLDTTHMVPLLGQQDACGMAILEKMRAVATQSPFYVAAAALAELEVGCCFQGERQSEAQDEIRRSIEINGLFILEFTKHTAAQYGALKTTLSRFYDRKVGKKNWLKWPEKWPGPIHGHPLGVDEFDLIMVSHAVERDLKFLTHDRMNRIREGLDLPPEMFDDWMSPSPGNDIA